jgi:hypothetical protein
VINTQTGGREYFRRLQTIRPGGGGNKRKHFPQRTNQKEQANRIRAIGKSFVKQRITGKGGTLKT